MPGKDGMPGIQAYKVNINDHSMHDILIPPSIVGGEDWLYSFNEINVFFLSFSSHLIESSTCKIVILYINSILSSLSILLQFCPMLSQKEVSLKVRRFRHRTVVERERRNFRG